MGQPERVKTFWKKTLKCTAKFQLPKAGSSMIFRWTLSGIDFKLQSPCPRCARFNSSWEIFKMVEFETSACLANYLGSGMSKARDGKDFHCAETVAAANIYAWSNEAVVLG